MKIYTIDAPEYSDYEHIKMNGFAISEGSNSYKKYLKKGVIKPKDKNTMFLELYSINVAPILWSASDFIVRDDVLELFKTNTVTNFRVYPAQIVKIATKGRRMKFNNYSGRGEPEDLIDKAKNIISEYKDLPILWVIDIKSSCEVEPDFNFLSEKSNNGLSGDGRILPYKFSENPSVDLFHPAYKKERYGGHLFCTERFKNIIEKAKIENIAFTPFSDWMNYFKSRY
jgi:hypothetical protein